MYPIQNAYMSYTYIPYLHLPLVQYSLYCRCCCTTFHIHILTRMYTVYMQIHIRYLYVCVMYRCIVLICRHMYVVNVCIVCVCVVHMHTHTTESTTLLCRAVFATISCSVSQCVAVCRSVLQCVAVCCSVLQCVAVHFSLLQCVAVCCSMLMLQYVAALLCAAQTPRTPHNISKYAHTHIYTYIKTPTPLPSPPPPQRFGAYCNVVPNSHLFATCVLNLLHRVVPQLARVTMASMPAGWGGRKSDE